VLQVLPAGHRCRAHRAAKFADFHGSGGSVFAKFAECAGIRSDRTSKSFSSTASGAGSLVTLPTDATIPPTEPAQVVVQPIVNNLAPGTYAGTLTLQFSDGRVSAVGITFVVTGAGSNASGRPTPFGRGSVSSSFVGKQFFVGKHFIHMHADETKFRC